MAEQVKLSNAPASGKKERKAPVRKDAQTRFGLATFAQLRPAMQMAMELMREGQCPNAEVVSAAGQLNSAIIAWVERE